MAVDDFTRIDSGEFAVGLKDINAVADTLELFSMLLLEARSDMIEDGLSRRAASVFHVLGGYLETRGERMNSLGQAG